MLKGFEEWRDVTPMPRRNMQHAQLIRAYHGGIGKTAIIYPAAFFVAIAMGQMTLGMVLYARLGLDVGGTRIGVLAGIWSVTYVFGCLVMRPWFNRVLPRYLIVASTAMTALLVLAMMATSRYAVLLGLYGAFGLVLSLVWPPMMGWVSTEYEGQALGRVIGRYNLSWCSGAVISPFLCGWLSEQDLRWPLLFAAALLLLVSVFVMGASLVLPRVRADFGTGAPHDAVPGDVDRSSPLRFPAWIGLYMSFFGMGLLVAVFPLIAIEAWSASEIMVGLVFTLRGLANIVAFVILGRIHAWHFRRLPMVGVQWIVVAVFALLAINRSIGGAVLLLGVFGAAMAMSYASSFFHGTTGSLNRARRMAIHEAVLAAGLMTGSVIGGWWYETLSQNGVFSMATLVLAFLAGVQTVVAYGKNGYIRIFEGHD